MSTAPIDGQLLADTVPVCTLGLSRVVLMDDARFAWVILVPDVVGARELIDLEAHDQHRLLDEIATVSRALKSLYRPDKLNVAALGNVVAQLHVHVIARFRDDAAWPRPVWGDGDRLRYEPAALATRLADLRAALATTAR